MKKLNLRIGAGVLAIIGLVGFFLIQQVDFTFHTTLISDNLTRFILNKSIRFIVNDLLAIALIYALFGERKYVHFAIAVQIFGLLFLLLPYFVLKLYMPGYNGPMINFLHRIILNPILMLLLIPAFYYQRINAKKVE